MNMEGRMDRVLGSVFATSTTNANALATSTDATAEQEENSCPRNFGPRSFACFAFTTRPRARRPHHCFSVQRIATLTNHVGRTGTRRRCLLDRPAERSHGDVVEFVPGGARAPHIIPPDDGQHQQQQMMVDSTPPLSSIVKKISGVSSTSSSLSDGIDNNGSGLGDGDGVGDGDGDGGVEAAAAGETTTTMEEEADRRRSKNPPVRRLVRRTSRPRSRPTPGSV